ncbi:MAG: beta-glucuronidase [Cetobacterium sp.]
MLYPIMTESRSLIDLNGIWKLKLDNGKGEVEKWYDRDLEGKLYNIPVPSSFNDLVEDLEFKEHVGNIWYEKKFLLSKCVFSERLVLRFASATHKAVVYLNGKELMRHSGGFLPFESEINEFIVTGENRITVMVNNVVDHTTLPVGSVVDRGKDFGDDKLPKRHKPNFDFFNYSGIHRPVKIYSTPKNYIKDISLVTDLEEDYGIIKFDVEYFGEGQIKVEIFDEEGNFVSNSLDSKGKIEIKNPKLWEPENAYLYDVKVSLINGEEVDIYHQPCGIRTVKVIENKFLINDKPFYFKGFGKHEDSHNHGKGLDEVLNVKDFSLMKWIGANSFRTAHYPYSEEIMRLADREGIVVIDEVAAVGLHLNFMAAFMGFPIKESTWATIGTAQQHRQDIQELMARDKNHPCVVMWSIANETALEEEGAYEYYKPLLDLTKKLDPQKRPVTIVAHQNQKMISQNDGIKIMKEFDVITLNRYHGWYYGTGDVGLMEDVIVNDINWFGEKFGKPIIFTEYGADTINGMKETVPTIFSEDYQKLFYDVHGRAFDRCPSFIGEQVWNFADFATDLMHSVMRTGGNKKGIFTRERKPKMAAYTLKERWTKIPNYNYK